MGPKERLTDAHNHLKEQEQLDPRGTFATEIHRRIDACGSINEALRCLKEMADDIAYASAWLQNYRENAK